jgi:hypothetical protein
MQKKQYKVIVPLKKADGGVYWMKIGGGFTNHDGSINIILDAIPRGAEWKFQLRELDAEDLRRRDEYRSRNAAAASPIPPAPSLANENIPF